jgi:TRAP-type C4-dicarboxylate transport system permease small subunit
LGLKAAQPSVGKAPTDPSSSGFGKSAEKVLDFLMNFIETAGAILLAAMTLIIIWQIIARFRIIHVISPWTEEVAMILLVWFGLTGAAIGIRKHLHIGVEFVTTLFPESVQKVMMIFVDILLACFSLFLLVKGSELAWALKDTDTPATLVSRGLVIYSAAPVAAFLMLIYSVELIVKQIAALRGKQE